MARLDDKIALVTGAAQGIGAAIAHAFVQEGAKVWLTDLDREGGQARARELGVGAHFAPLDVAEEADWARVMKDLLARHGRLDILVNNAAVTGIDSDGPQDPEHARLEDWRRVHRINLDGVFLGCQAAIKAMRPQGSGSIINMASRAGIIGVPGAVAYGSSKAAILNHTRSVALHCAGEGLAIRCNSISPAAVLTPIWEPMLGDGPDREARMAMMVADTPIKRFGTPAEVAALAVLLASDEVAYMTGADLPLDGGLGAGTVAPAAKAEEP